MIIEDCWGARVRQDVGISLQLHTIGESPMTLQSARNCVRPPDGSRKTCKFWTASKVNLAKIS
jgi:hypothetical protein